MVMLGLMAGAIGLLSMRKQQASVSPVARKRSRSNRDTLSVCNDQSEASVADVSSVESAELISAELSSSTAAPPQARRKTGGCMEFEDPKERLLHVSRCQGCSACESCPLARNARSMLEKLQEHGEQCGEKPSACALCAKLLLVHKYLEEESTKNQFLHVSCCQGCSVCQGCPRYEAARSSLEKLRQHGATCKQKTGCSVCGKLQIMRKYIKQHHSMHSDACEGHVEETKKAPEDRFQRKVGAQSLKMSQHGGPQGKAKTAQTQQVVDLPEVVLRRGSKGPAVARLQQALVQAGIMPSKAICLWQGFYGPRTHTAIVKLQQACGLEPTGVYDDVVRGHLAARLEHESRPECHQM